MDETTPLLLRNQSHALSKKRLLAVFPALALIQFTSFLDQTAISTSLPAIASALDTGASISLVGASFLITSTSIQLINGRLSDIFGRKAALVTALCIMGAGNLWSGFCTTPLQLFVSRACTGFGAGAINALVQIAIADITTLEQRGYYFGMVGMAVAFGNGLGPVVGGVLTQSFGWRWAFCFWSPLMLLWPAITIHWATFKEAFRTRGFAALWNPTKQLEYGVASLLSETSEGFIEYESTTVVPSLVKQARGKILELGPGPGNQIHRFDPDLVESICAIDPNPNFNDDIALKLQASALESRYKFVVCGVEDSDILRAEGVTEGSLDTILSIQVMCAVNDPHAIMKEVWKLLKPGGQFIFWEHGKSRDTLTSIGQTLWNPAWSTFVGCNMNRDIRGAILAAGEWEGLENVEETDDPLTFLPRFWGVLVKKA
ncbi:hypothetical protein NHJ6243_002412 [Beauveria neobassiana]